MAIYTTPLGRALPEVGLGFFLITGAYEGRDSVQRGFRVIPLSEGTEPRIGVALLTSYEISDLIRRSGELVVNVAGPKHIPPPRPPRHERPPISDEFEGINATRMPASIVQAPLVKDCAAYVECAVEQEVLVGDRSLFIARVLACQVDDAILPVVRVRGHDLDLTGFAGLMKRQR